MVTDDVIKIENLKFSYSKAGDSVPLLSIPSFVVKRGERVFLQGQSGSGKTTLLGLITGVLNATVGKVLVMGTDFSTSSASTRDAVRGEEMGYIFQLFNLIPYLTVAQNISLPCRLHSKRRARLEGKSLDSEVERLAKALGIDQLLHQPVSNLSVGQQQRVAAARALIGKPELIIADEPTSALDHDHRGRFIELLMEECKEEKTSLLFVSHDPTLAQYFDRRVSIEEINRRPST